MIQMDQEKIYEQKDHLLGFNGQNILYNLYYINSSESNIKDISRVDNETIKYYKFNNDDDIKIIPYITTIVIKTYDLESVDIGNPESFINNINNFQDLEDYLNYKTPSLEEFLLYELENTNTYKFSDEDPLTLENTINVYIDINGNCLMSDQIFEANQVNSIYDIQIDQYKEIDKQEIFSDISSNEDDISNEYTIKEEDKINKQTEAISYDNLINKPNLFSGSYNDLTDKPSLFSGNYNDLNGLPTNLVNTITLNRTIALLSILITDPTYTLQSSDNLVQIWVELINSNTYSINDVPNLSNLRTLVTQEIN